MCKSYNLCMKNMESRSKKTTSNFNATTFTMENLYDFNSKDYLATFRAVTKKKKHKSWNNGMLAKKSMRLKTC